MTNGFGDDTIFITSLTCGNFLVADEERCVPDTFFLLFFYETPLTYQQVFGIIRAQNKRRQVK
nr:MAG TPA: hypothetical protein [Caudoviricetes sp.]